MGGPGEGVTITLQEHGATAQGTTANGSDRSGRRRSGPSTSLIARLAAVGALGAAVLLVVLILFGGGNGYTVNAIFTNASSLVTGNQVLIGPVVVGSVDSISLTPDSQAKVVMSLSPDAAPLHRGTVARVYENSLSGIANKYVVIVPGPLSAPVIPSGGVIPETHTYSQVSLDALFDSLDPLTRAGLAGFIRGSAQAIKGRALESNRALQYFAPALASTSDVTAALSKDEPAFDGLLVKGAQALSLLSSRATELTQLVANTSATTGAIAKQSTALEQALALFPPALNKSTATFAGLRQTLDALTPVVVKSIPNSRLLEPFAAGLRALSQVSIPTLAKLNDLINNPSGGDLTSLLLQTPGLARIAVAAFPRMIHQMNYSQPQLNAFREYAPDVVASLADLGQASAYYDANGHYARTQPEFAPFGLNAANQLYTQSNALRYAGLKLAYGRCPGGAVQPSPDGSAPWLVPGCKLTTTPVGP
jgi:phospholipid/cholesterol/gamma-HCH transport system substrate-binding protein